MSLVNRLLTKVGGLSNTFNPNNLSGAIDVVVVQHPDGRMFGSPFNARFGKSHVLRPRDNDVELQVNDQKVTGLKARLGPTGAVYFPAESAAVETLPDRVSPGPGGDDDDSGNYSEPEVYGGGGGESGGSGWRSGQQMAPPPPRKSATSASLSAPPTPPSSMPPSPASSFTSLLFGDDDEDSSAQQIRLTSEQLQFLGLQPGANRLRYTITTKFQGSASCDCAVYLWRHDDRLVVSDIDGTITKSDVFGQVLPILGKDWTQPTVVRLFSAVERNGYRFMYLSSRGLGQSRTTRHFLEGVSQDGVLLPDGPILLSPTSLLAAFHREVITRRPQDFKIPCLKEIAALFPPTHQPFWAGFGNRLSDAATYKEVGIPAERCFTVNSSGELLRGYGDGVDCSVERNCGSPPIDSYRALADIVDHVFPPTTWEAAEDLCGSGYFDWPSSRPTKNSVAAAAATAGATVAADADAMQALAETEARRRRSSNNLAMWLSEVNLYL